MPASPGQTYVPKSGIKNCHCEHNSRCLRMLKTKENGFSLIELLIVVVVIGIIAALAVPALRKGIWAAQNGNTFATMRTISSTQAGFFTQKERFGRLDEVNSLIGNGLGNV